MGLGFRVRGSGFGVWGLGFGGLGSGFGVQGLVFGVWCYGLWLRVPLTPRPDSGIDCLTCSIFASGFGGQGDQLLDSRVTLLLGEHLLRRARIYGS